MGDDGQLVSKGVGVWEDQGPARGLRGPVVDPVVDVMASPSNFCLSVDP